MRRELRADFTFFSVCNLSHAIITHYSETLVPTNKSRDDFITPN